MKVILFSPPMINLGLRGLTLGARFLLIFTLAKFLNPTELGFYGLFTASVGYALYFVGMDFYIYVTREILKENNDHKGKVLAAQIRISIVLYVIFIPIFLFVLSHFDWPAALVFGFVPIVILEHINQELYRLLVALSRQLTASVVLFLRQAVWAIVFVGLVIWRDDARSLDVIVILWITSGIFAAIIGMSQIYRMRFGGWCLPIDWRWVRKGLQVSALFLVATLALRGINTIDRYFIEYYASIEVVGAYVLFFGVSSTLMTFMDAAVFAFTYPQLIRLYQSGKNKDAQNQVRRLWQLSVLGTVFFAVVSWLLLPVLLNWINQPIYTKYLFLYPWVFAGTTVFMFSMIPHYALYAQNKDRPIVYSHIIALGVFAVATPILGAFFSVLAVPVAILLSFLVILGWKSLTYRKTII